MGDIEVENMIYNRQATLSLVRHDRAIVVGVGGTGSWVSIGLAMMGTPEITIIDPDRVEAHNLNRLPLPPSTVGRLKVRAMEAELVRLRPSMLVTALPLRWSPGLLDDMQCAVFDCTDRMDTQTSLYGEVKRHGGEYYRSGCDANNISSTTEIPWIQTDVPVGYGAQGIPVWIGPAALAAMYTLGVAVARWTPYSGRISRLV